MTYVSLFNFDGIQFRTLKNEAGDIFFVAMDVCQILGYSNGRDAVAKHCKSDGVAKCDIIDSLGRNQSATIISEPNLYRLIIKSNKPEAESFEKLVMETVLPSIRKTGSYSVTTKEISRKDLALMIIQAEEEKEKAVAQLSEATKQIEANKPKVAFADAVSVSNDSILIGELAKILKQNGVNIGQNRLFEWMRMNGYLINRKATDYNMPTQYSMDRGLFKIKETAIARSDGNVTIGKTVKVTGSGQQYFIHKFLPAS